MSENSNLKRKNEELDSVAEDQLNKRVALDSEQVALNEHHEDQAQTAPVIGVPEATTEVEVTEKEETGDGDIEITDDAAEYSPENVVVAPSQSVEEEAAPVPVPTLVPDANGDFNVEVDTTPAGEENQEGISESHSGSVSGSDEQNDFHITSGDSQLDDNYSGSKPISNHREKDNDPTYIVIRMYCPVKEAGIVVGKKGDKIKHIREKANVRMDVSENLKNVPERIVTVRGPSENVARAFGLISRTILDEPEDEPASMLSRQYHLRILVPHPLIGFIIGKQGSKFREIEENSAAKLKAAEHPLPYSTDRVLSITGVGDSIHIAIYYIAQVMIEHKECLKKNKILYYNPANYHKTQEQSPVGPPMIPNNFSMMTKNLKDNLYKQPPPPQQYQHHAIDQHQHHQQLSPQHQHMQHQQHPQHQQHQQHQQPIQSPYGQKQQPYNFQMMFQPTIHPQQQYGMAPVNQHPMQHQHHQMGGNSMQEPPMSIPPQPSYQDEHGNTIVGDVVTLAPVPIGNSADKFNQDIFVANHSIGSVIGKGGANIRQIREKSACTYVKIEPDKGQSIMLGGGKGLTNIRKLTLTGGVGSLNTAIYLINQRIAADKERNSH